ncbi:MAG: molecular chaperone TorD family protein [Thermodesulfovibrionales bacterium]|nr:molecular chaperone TorD family protein [Thermodesulfovibrionales bacterium]
MALYDNVEDIERAELYRLFAGLFIHEPTDEIIIQLKDMFQMKFADSPQEIRIDFASIFLGPDGRLMPYESFYNYPLGDRPRLWGKAAEEVQSFYISAGIVMDEEINLIPDHISAEMLFMSYLIENGILELQKRFLEEHLVKWIPEYCNELQKYASTGFYKEVANIIKEFILSEAEVFKL